MERFEDVRINEALELLNAVARDRKTDLQSAIRDKYAELRSVVTGFTDDAKTRATESLEAGKQKVEEVATDIDQSVRRNPYAFIGGAALVGLVIGMLISRSRKD
jgi:ElaB/YqjD/DUF883 family membrane-anchored ribosome-binding protein